MSKFILRLEITTMEGVHKLKIAHIYAPDKNEALRIVEKIENAKSDVLVAKAFLV